MNILTAQGSNGLYVGANADGSVMALSTNGFRSTYAYRWADASITQANPTDVMTLTGSATKVVRITKVGVSGKATAASLVDLYLGKRSTADTGGTVVAGVTPSKYDSLDPDATAVVTLYTANPTLGTTSGGFEGDIIYLPAIVTPAGEPSHWERQYGASGGGAKCPVLRGVNEQFVFSLNGINAPAGNNFYFYIEWTEDNI